MTDSGSTSTGLKGRLELLLGAAAEQAVADRKFVADWERLHGACPWATAYQGPPFVSSWYDSYGSRYQPVIVVRRNSAGDLDGLLFLAADRQSGDIVQAGAHQAEYQAWLAPADDNNRFICAALQACVGIMRGSALLFHYLAPGAPTDWCGEGPGFRAVHWPHPRHQMAVGPMSRVEASLRKKSNKSRLSRLKRVGEVRLEQVETECRFREVVDQIATQCDFRQGAINDVLPFSADPHKRDFHIAMSRRPGLLHTTLLWVGDELAASHVGTVSGRSVALGVITHSPFLASHSPGKLLLLLLGRALGSQGFEFFDLTPGGAYKERSGTHTDTVYTVQVFFRRRDFERYRVRAAVADGARGLLSVLGIEREVFHRATELLNKWFSCVRRLPRRMRIRSLIAVPRRLLWSTREYPIYHMSATTAIGLSRVDSSAVLRTNVLGDLLLYAPPTATASSRQEFLSDAMHRLEHGQVVYSTTDGGELLHCSWLDPCTKGKVTDLSCGEVELAPGSAVLGDDFTYSGAQGPGLQELSVGKRLEDFANGPASANASRWIFTCVPPGDSPLRKSIEGVGFYHCRSAWRSTRLGRRRYWVDPGCDNCAEQQLDEL